MIRHQLQLAHIRCACPEGEHEHLTAPTRNHMTAPAHIQLCNLCHLGAPEQVL